MIFKVNPINDTQTIPTKYCTLTIEMANVSKFVNEILYVIHFILPLVKPPPNVLDFYFRSFCVLLQKTDSNESKKYRKIDLSFLFSTESFIDSWWKQRRKKYNLFDVIKDSQFSDYFVSSFFVYWRKSAE